MNKISVVIIATAVLAIVAASAASADESKQSPEPRAAGVSPFACDRLALSPEIRKRHFEELGPALRKLKKSTRELADGYEFEFPADQTTYQMLAEWVFQERLCCPFFDIDLRSEREGGSFWLRLSGRPGTKDFIKADGAVWVKQ
jgi:hypothetical protein